MPVIRNWWQRRVQRSAALRAAMLRKQWADDISRGRARSVEAEARSVMAWRAGRPADVLGLTANYAAWEQHFGPDHPRALAAQEALSQVRQQPAG